jgi:hypothetical protein
MADRVVVSLYEIGQSATEGTVGAESVLLLCQDLLLLHARTLAQVHVGSRQTGSWRLLFI